MKKIIGITICFVLLLLTSLSIASEGNRIVYIDLQEALNSADSGKKAKEVFKVEVDRIQKDLDKKQDELKTMKDELEKRALLLSEETRVKKEQEYQEKLKKFQRFYQDAQDDLKGKDAQLTRNIIIDLRKVITKLGEEKGYAMILEKNESNVLYAPKENDITSEVVKRLNEGIK
jgi:outer membrane protein